MGGNVETMQRVVEQTLAQGNDYVEYMLHSSEYMPGGARHLRMNRILSVCMMTLSPSLHGCSRVRGMTLADYYQQKLYSAKQIS
jgi:hypothetical protein